MIMRLMIDQQSLHKLQRELTAVFFGSVILSNVFWGIVLYNQWVAVDKTLVGIPMLSLIVLLGNSYQKKPEPIATVFAASLGFLSAILQPAYMILGK